MCDVNDTMIIFKRTLPSLIKDHGSIYICFHDKDRTITYIDKNWDMSSYHYGEYMDKKSFIATTKSSGYYTQLKTTDPDYNIVKMMML